MKKLFICCSIFLGIMSCEQKKADFDLQGHRGCRGLMPENTIPAFLRAIDLGVTTLELDLAVSKDGKLIVSHEPYMSSEICLDTLGNEIPDSAQLSHNIYQMTVDQIRLYDCGSKIHPRFPEQEKMPVTKPLLSEVISAVKDYELGKGKKPLRWNIEIKSSEESDNLYHPTPAVFSDIVFSELDGELIWDFVTIQSFDFRVLAYFHQKYPQVTLAALVENDLGLDRNLENLGFKPDIYSCDFTLLSRQSVDSLHHEGIKVIPWTVNEVADMKQLKDWGVDGLITDYPDRFKLLEDE